MHNIYFNGKAGKDCNLFVSGEATFDAPEKEVERVSIPGRNGDILISQSRYKNVTVRYPAFIPRGLKANAHALRAWLMSAPLYTQRSTGRLPSRVFSSGKLFRADGI